jgi:hypothetical protein
LAAAVRIRRVAVLGKRAESAGHVDDAGGLRFAQQREHCLGDRRGTKEVRAQDTLDGVEPSGEDWTVKGIVDAGVVDQNVETAEPGDDRAGSSLDGRVIGDIDGNDVGVDSFGSKPASGFFAGCFVVGSQQDNHARPSDLACYFKPEALIRSRDERESFRRGLHVHFHSVTVFLAP